MHRAGLQRFFDALGPRLEMAQTMDERLNSELALRFNVLDYIRTSELGLSRVIADLLDPSATHGQKMLFLDAFLCGLQSASRRRDRPLDLTRDYNDKWKVAKDTVRVTVERTIPPGRRRLDISVEFKGNDGRRRCLAIENKPYAGDQKRQIQDYLDFMESEYGSRDGDQPTNHLLVYLSRVGELPSEWSVDKKRLAREIEEYDFAVMGYSKEGSIDSGHEQDGASESRLRLDYSLADWFDACRRDCDVERLRNFLRDAEAFCRQHFGGVAMPNTTQEQIRQFLEDPKNLKIAMAVHRHWPEVRADIVKRFAERLTERISAHLAERLPQLGAMSVEHSVTGHNTTWQAFKVYRDEWHGKGVRIQVEAQKRGGTDWIIGVASRSLRDTLKEPLASALGKHKSSAAWPWYRSVDDRWRWWYSASVVPILKQELENDGDATRYFVDQVAELCKVAVPIIDEAVR